MVGACSMVNSEGLGGWQWDINILMIPNVDLTSYDVFFAACYNVFYVASYVAS